MMMMMIIIITVIVLLIKMITFNKLQTGDGRHTIHRGQKLSALARGHNQVIIHILLCRGTVVILCIDYIHIS